MHRAELEAAGDLAGEALAAGGRFVADVHAGIASRPFGILGPWAAPVRFVHDGVSRGVYGAVRGGLRGLARGGGAIAAWRADGSGAHDSARGSIALGALNGLYGDHLAALASPFALRMEIRRDGAAVSAAAFPDATPRVVVFVHGLGETEHAWRLGGGRTYGELLQEELGFTPVFVRYNTGLRISANGRALAELLDELCAEWPTGVEDLVLVGHSMGGLVARSACHYGEPRWTGAVRHVFCLGSPHLGADLEKGVNALGHALGRLPETRALAGALKARSVGIKDLRYGACVDEDWSDCDPDEFLRDRCTEVPFLPRAHYYFIGTRIAGGPLGNLLGDLLVRVPSASGRGSGKGRSIPFEVDNGHELVGLTHMQLLNHPAVYGQLRTWLTRRALPASR